MNSMNLFDSHNHLQDARFDANRSAVLERASAAYVNHMVVCGTTEHDWPSVQSLAAAHPSVIIPGFGLHPWWIGERRSHWRAVLCELLQHESAVVGEVGLDFAVTDSNATEQEAVFQEHVEISVEFCRPVIIHCRKAWDRMLTLLREWGPHPAGYVLHAYSGGAARVEELVALNAWFSFSGSLCRPNNRRGPQALLAVPLDRLLFETDAPDMSPIAGECCEPLHLTYILRTAARCLNVTEEDIARVGFTNAMRLFSGVLS